MLSLPQQDWERAMGNRLIADTAGRQLFTHG